MSLKHMILGMLRNGPQSGYELNGQFNIIIRYFWNTELSQIYRALHKMRDDSWVEFEHVHQDGYPDKKVYSLTETGRSELRRWLSTPHEERLRIIWVGQLQFGDEISADELISVLEARVAWLQERLDYLEDRLQSLQPGLEVPYPRDVLVRFKGMSRSMLALEYGIRHHRFHIEWTRDAITALELQKAEFARKRK